MESYTNGDLPTCLARPVLEFTNIPSICNGNLYNKDYKAYPAARQSEQATTTPSKPASRSIGTPTLTAIPNPTTGQVTFHYSVFTDGAVSITVANIMGMKVYEAMHNEFQTSGMHQKQSDLSTLPNGVYLVTIETGGYKQTERLVISY